MIYSKKGCLLVEIGVEELPFNLLKDIKKLFSIIFSSELKKNFLFFSEISFFVTLRRMVCLVKNINFISKREEYVYGPNFSIEDDENIVLNRINCWCDKFKINIKKIKYKQLVNNKKICFVKKKTSQNILTLIPLILKKTILNLCVNFKLMRWCDNNQEYKFIKPVRNFVLMFDKQVIPADIFGIYSNNVTFSCRFLNYHTIIIKHATTYLYQLSKYGNFLLSSQQRKKKLKKILGDCLNNKFFLLNKQSFFQKALLIVENPFLLKGQFNINFLYLPQEIVCFVVEDKNKCFLLLNSSNNITNHYLIISGTYLVNNYDFLLSYQNIMESDFFIIGNLIKKDRKKKFFTFLKSLKDIIFYQKLGSILDKVKRIIFIARKILRLVKKLTLINRKILFRCIMLCKCDLGTMLCKIYPKLKGVIGMYYSGLDKEQAIVSLVIKEHYYPRYINDYIPTNLYSIIVSLSDKLDTIVGLSLITNLFVINKSNDPYGLRRLSVLILDIILCNKIYINLYVIIEFVVFLFQKNILEKKVNIYLITNFILKRALNLFIKKDYNKNIVCLFLKNKNFDILDIQDRIIAFSKFSSLDIKKLFLLNKRLHNILNVNNSLILGTKKINISLLIKKQEKKIYTIYQFLKREIMFCSFTHNYDKLVDYFLVFCKEIDIFFIKVRIDVKSVKLKLNRIYLLFKIKNLILKFFNLN